MFLFAYGFTWNNQRVTGNEEHNETQSNFSEFSHGKYMGSIWKKKEGEDLPNSVLPGCKLLQMGLQSQQCSKQDIKKWVHLVTEKNL